MFKLLKDLHLAFSARIASYFRKQEILRVQKMLHMQDLAEAPVYLHPQIRAQHKVELDGIRAGKLTIVNRRTTGNVGIPMTMTRINTPVPKFSPLSLRRFSRTPIAARAINLVKAGLMALPWDVRHIEGNAEANDPDVRARIEIAKHCFTKPNDDDSFNSLTEQLLTDFLVYGMGVAELRLNPNDMRPVKWYAVDASTIQIVPKWDESNAETMPRYAQALPYTNGANEILLYDDEIMAIRDNIASDTPFGTGCLEIAYRSVSDLLGVQKMAGIAGADQLGRTIFWWSGTIPAGSMADMRSYLQGELEGMARVGMVGGGPKPEVVKIDPVSIDDLLLPWQEMLIRMIAASFNMSAMALNVTNDVNRAVGSVLSDMDFRTAIVPVAKRFQESYTRRILHVKMGWSDLEFVYTNTEDPDLETKIEMLNTLVTANGETPNGMRKAMGMKPLNSPFADMLQIEMSILQSAVTSMLKPTPAPTNPDGTPQDPSQGFGDGTGGFSQPAGQADPATGKPGAGVAKLKPLAKPSLKKLPKPTAPKLAPTKLKQFSAQQISGMSVPMIRALQQTGVIPSTGIGLANDMEQEQPGILETMSEQVWTYLESLAEHEISNSKTKKSQLNKKWTNLARKRYGKNVARVKKLSPDSLNPISASGLSKKLLTAKVKRSPLAPKGLRY